MPANDPRDPNGPRDQRPDPQSGAPRAPQYAYTEPDPLFGPAPQPVRRPRRVSGVVVLAAVLALLILALAVGLGTGGIHLGGGADRTAPAAADLPGTTDKTPSVGTGTGTTTPTATTTAPAPATQPATAGTNGAASAITIDMKSGAVVGPVFGLSGFGTIPPGYKLILFVQAPATGLFYTDGTAQVPSPGEWRFPKVYIGSGADCDKGQTYPIILVMAPDAVAEANRVLHNAYPNRGYNADEFSTLFGHLPSSTTAVILEGVAHSGC